MVGLPSGRGRRGGPGRGQGPVLGADTPVLSPQKPILLQGHERSITQIKYNREGDLLFTVAKDPVSGVRRAGGRRPSEGPGARGAGGEVFSPG